MPYILEDIIGYTVAFFHPALVIGPLITILLIAWLWREKSRRRILLLSPAIILLLAIQLIGCYYVFPLDLLPWRQDIVVKTVAVENYTISLVQDPEGSEYFTYFRIQDSEGREASFAIDVDSSKIWRVKLSEKDNRIYFNVKEYTKQPYIDTLKMTVNNGDHGVEKTIASFFEAKIPTPPQRS